MKTRSWILVLTLAASLSGLLGLFFLRHGETSFQAEVFSGGEKIMTVDLLKDESFLIPASGGGFNRITVRSGKIAVTEASCPDHYCMHRGFCNSGAPIICLPNGLEIRFENPSQPDFSLG